MEVNGVPKYLLLNPQQQAGLEKMLSDAGVPAGQMRVIDDGTFAYVDRLAYTYGLFLGCDMQGLTYRFCFSTKEGAMAALQSVRSYTDIPSGDWIACRPQQRLPQPCFFDSANGRLNFDQAWKDGLYTEEALLERIRENPSDNGLKNLLEKLKGESSC